ncbi:MAG TPA: universal stress protein, partial [Burkholderiales bacterium]|nr:universal stress protein [Burkholderiales bacterium]
MAREFRILLASDGSPSAHAAAALALAFPWPRRSLARAVVALGPQKLVEEARRRLAARWPRAEAVALDVEPAEAILGEQRRMGADVVVLGWRGHGSFRRLLAGSVSRKVAESAPCPVLVVRTEGTGSPRKPKRFVVGYDGSPNARRVLRLLERFEPPAGNRLFLVGV